MTQRRLPNQTFQVLSKKYTDFVKLPPPTFRPELNSWMYTGEAVLTESLNLKNVSCNPEGHLHKVPWFRLRGFE